MKCNFFLHFNFSVIEHNCWVERCAQAKDILMFLCLCLCTYVSIIYTYTSIICAQKLNILLSKFKLLLYFSVGIKLVERVMHLLWGLVYLWYTAYKIGLVFLLHVKFYLERKLRMTKNEKNIFQTSNGFCIYYLYNNMSHFYLFTAVCLCAKYLSSTFLQTTHYIASHIYKLTKPK